MTAKTQAQKATLQFLASLRQRNASVHTLKAYRGDLEAFSAYIGQRDLKAVDHVAIRGFLSHLYHKGLGKTSVARALAALRSLYHWMAQEGMVQQNPAALVSTPKLPKKLPRVPTIEEMNIDQAVKAGVLALHKGFAPAIAVEFARRVIPEEARPTFEETEALFRNARTETHAAAA